MGDQRQLTRCPGCGGLFEPCEGPAHRYMISSAGCWERFGRVLAREYSNYQLMLTHRLTVDAYALQHPGTDSPPATHSVGLHLARLMLQIETVRSPAEANRLMLVLAKHKATLPRLVPPSSFNLTVLDIPLSCSFQKHASAVRAWAATTWADWSAHHAFIRRWVERIEFSRKK